MGWYYKLRYSSLMTRYVLLTDITRNSRTMRMYGTRRGCYRAGRKYGGNWMVKRADAWHHDFERACGVYSN